MRLGLAITIAIAASTVMPAFATVPSAPPDAATVAKLEAKLGVPPGGKPITTFDRYYQYLEERSGRLTILGFFQPAEAPDHVGQVHRLASTERMPIVYDGGCAFLWVRWDVEAAKVTSASCGGR